MSSAIRSPSSGARETSVSRARGPRVLRSSEGRRVRPRLCVVCRESTDRAGLLRFVAAPGGEVVPDLAGGAFGRGAWVHPTAVCLAGAPRVLGRALHAELAPGAWARCLVHLRGAAERRISGLLRAAARAGHLRPGADAAEVAMRQGAPLLVVATDARAAAELGFVRAAVAAGRAVAFGEKAALGRLVGRDEVALLAVTDNGLAAAVREARHWLVLAAGAAPDLEGAREDG